MFLLNKYSIWHFKNEYILFRTKRAHEKKRQEDVEGLDHLRSEGTRYIKEEYHHNETNTKLVGSAGWENWFSWYYNSSEQLFATNW